VTKLISLNKSPQGTYAPRRWFSALSNTNQPLLRQTPVPGCYRKKLYFLSYATIVMALLSASTFGSTISMSDIRLELPGDWKSSIEKDGVSSIIEKDAGGFYKTFTLSLSDKVSDSEFKKSKADFSQYFNSIEKEDKSLKLVTGDLVFQSKNGIQFNYFILFGIDHNVLTFYALTSIRERVILISYRIYQATEDLHLWEKEFTTVLNSLM